MFSQTRSRAAVLALSALFAACGGSPSGPQPGAPDEADAPDRFSIRRALGELEMLISFGPRPSGSQAATAARQRIRAILEESRIRVETIPTPMEIPGVGELTFRHLVASLPGESADRIVLVAPYDSGDPDRISAGDGASGAALLLELAQVFAHRDHPYTLEFVWLEGEGRLGRGPEETRDLRWLGSSALARNWSASGRLDGIRLLVAVNRVCDLDLVIARDIVSHRNHREALFLAARAIGRGDAFPAEQPYASVVSSHLAFQRAGLRPVVAIEDASPELVDEEGAVPERCAAASLETVGLVLIEGIERIGARLAKIDRFSRVPAARPDAWVAKELPEPSGLPPATTTPDSPPVPATAEPGPEPTADEASPPPAPEQAPPSEPTGRAPEPAPEAAGSAAP